MIVPQPAFFRRTWLFRLERTGPSLRHRGPYRGHNPPLDDTPILFSFQGGPVRRARDSRPCVRLSWNGAHSSVRSSGRCCGLAVYGRNNIAYVEGLGSHFRLSAFYSNLPTETDIWRKPRMMERCRTVHHLPQ